MTTPDPRTAEAARDCPDCGHMPHAGPCHFGTASSSVRPPCPCGRVPDRMVQRAAETLWALDGGSWRDTFTDDARAVLAAALAVDPLRQADTMPVDRDLLRDLRSFLGTYAPWTEAGDLLRRLPNPDEEPQ